jgi:hypothetical protein
MAADSTSSAVLAQAHRRSAIQHAPAFVVCRCVVAHVNHAPDSAACISPCTIAMNEIRDKPLHVICLMSCSQTASWSRHTSGRSWRRCCGVAAMAGNKQQQQAPADAAAGGTAEHCVARPLMQHGNVMVGWSLSCLPCRYWMEGRAPCRDSGSGPRQITPILSGRPW